MKSSSLGWNNYWQDSSQSSAFEKNSPSDAVLAISWEQQLKECFESEISIKMLDVGCGNGVVTRTAINLSSLINKMELDCYCLDLSKNAIESIEKEYPQTTCVVANAAEMPWTDNSFNLVVSQFGIEYSGIKGFEEAIRILSIDGLIVFIMHLKDGKIYQESDTNLKLVKKFIETKFIDESRKLFSAGFGLMQGSCGKKEFNTADEKLSISVERVKIFLNKISKQGPANGFLSIFKSIAHMSTHIESYQPQDVFLWLDNVENELNDYMVRTEAMINSAMDSFDFEKLLTFFKGSGLVIETKKILTAENDSSPFAYLVKARKKG